MTLSVLTEHDKNRWLFSSLVGVRASECRLMSSTRLLQGSYNRLLMDAWGIFYKCCLCLPTSYLPDCGRQSTISNQRMALATSVRLPMTHTTHSDRLTVTNSLQCFFFATHWRPIHRVTLSGSEFPAQRQANCQVTKYLMPKHTSIRLVLG